MTVGGLDAPPEETYEDIEKIFKANEVNFKTHEEKRENGLFRSYSVSTEGVV